MIQSRISNLSVSADSATMLRISENRPNPICRIESIGFQSLCHTFRLDETLDANVIARHWKTVNPLNSTQPS